MNYWEALLNWMIQLNIATMRTLIHNQLIIKKEIEDEKREIDNMLRECFDHVAIHIE
jgi:hypothetical protein